MTESNRPIPMDTPNEFAYSDFKKYAYKKRGMFKKEMLKHIRKGDGQADGSKMFMTISALWYKWAYHNNKEFTHIKDKLKFGRELMKMMVQDDLIFSKDGWKKDNRITHIKESGLRGQTSGDSALDMANHLRRYGVKKILKQPNDKVTYFHLNNASEAPRVVQMLKKMFGIKAQIDNHMYSPSPAVKFDNDQLVESVNEALKKDGHIYNHEAVNEFGTEDRISSDKALVGKDGILGNGGIFISWADIKSFQKKYRG